MNRSLKNIEPMFNVAVDLLLTRPGKVVVTGLGKSGIVGHKIASTLASTGSTAVFVNAAEGLHGDLGVVCRGDVVVMVSNSAETEELYRWFESLKSIGVRVIGIFGRTDTRLGSYCDVVLDASICGEACPLESAPMTSSTVALVIGDAIAAALMKARGFTREQFAVFHPGGSLGRRLFLKVRDVAKPVDQVAVIDVNATVRDALNSIERFNMGLVVVVDRDRSVRGVISDGDFRRCMLGGVSLEASVTSIMAADPIVVSGDLPLSEALLRMEGHRKVYVLPIVEPDGRLAGVIRMHDIVGRG